MNKLDKSCDYYYETSKCGDCPCNDLPKACSTVALDHDEPMKKVLRRNIKFLRMKLEELQTLVIRCDEEERSEEENHPCWWKTKEEEDKEYEERIHNRVKSINTREDLYQIAWNKWRGAKKIPLQKQYAYWLGRASALQDATAYHWDELPKEHLYNLLDKLDIALEYLEFIDERMKGEKSNGKEEKT